MEASELKEGISVFFIRTVKYMWKKFKVACEQFQITILIFLDLCFYAKVLLHTVVWEIVFLQILIHTWTKAFWMPEKLLSNERAGTR